MKVYYRDVPEDVQHALSRRDIERLHEVVPEDILRRIIELHVYYNTRTAVRGLIAFRRKGIIIRINFWTWRRRTRIDSHWPEELPFIRSLGGSIDRENGVVVWTGDSARRFALFILLHEISHLLFKLSHPHAGAMQGGNRYEEAWCDEKAKELLQRLS